MKVDLKLVASVLKGLITPEVESASPGLAAAVIRKLQRELPADTEATEPKPKKQFCVFVLPPAGVTLPPDLTGWVVQIDESENCGTAFEKVAQAAAIFNTTKKSRKRQVKLTGEAFELVGAKQFKEVGMSVKTKTPVWIVPVPAEVPAADSGT